MVERRVLIVGAGHGSILLKELTRRKQELNVILNSTHDAMIAINLEGNLTLFNRAAEKLLNKKAEDVLGSYVADVIPNTRLPIILNTGEAELNREQELNPDVKIITNRMPVFGHEIGRASWRERVYI